VGAPRRFDHDEAYARWLAGESQTAIAASYGVSQAAVSQAVLRHDPAKRAALNAYHRAYQRERLRKPCVRGCGRLAWHGRGREGVCIPCTAAARTTTVRETELLCTKCDEWKPDEAFPHGHGKARRGRHSLCRTCQTRERQDYRERHKVPCVHCGAPCLPFSEKGARAADTGLCRACWVKSLNAAGVSAA
jgi:hypothetical protein